VNAEQVLELVELRRIMDAGGVIRPVPHCVSCGDAVFMEVEHRSDGAGRVRLGHPLPLCPEFARAIEDVE
jgi:ribosomal protein S27AE